MKKLDANVLGRRRLTSFIYVLLRDDLTGGKVEDIMKNHVCALVNVYSNPFLAAYAESLADRLMLGAKKPPKRTVR